MYPVSARTMSSLVSTKTWYRQSDAIECTYAAPSIAAWVAVAQAVALPNLRKYPIACRFQ